MWALVLAVVVAQSPVVKRVSDGRATAADLRALQYGRPFSRPDLAALEQVAAVASRVSTCARPPPECVGDVSECMSRFSLILSAVASRGQSTPKFIAWAEAALKSDDLRAHPPARRLLARAGHPGTEANALQLLRRNTYQCIDEGARLLSFVPTLSDDARVAVTTALPSENGQRIGELVASRDEPWAQALALDALRSADGHLRLGVVRALRKNASNELKAAANLAANCDPLQRLREDARTRLKALGERVSVVNCPAFTWSVEGSTVTDGTTRVALTRASTTASCDGGIGVFDGRCVVAHDFGEWGGALGVSSTDGGFEPFATSSFLNPRALLVQRDETLVLSSVQHMSGSGALGRLVRGADGGASYEAQLHFLSAPSAWAATGEQRFVEFEGSELWSPCGRSAPFVMVYERDGGFALAASAATRCLRQR